MYTVHTRAFFWTQIEEFSLLRAKIFSRHQYSVLTHSLSWVISTSMTKITPTQYNDANYLREIICGLQYERGVVIEIINGERSGGWTIIDILNVRGTGQDLHIEARDVIEALHVAHECCNVFRASESQKKIQARQNALNKLTPEEILLLGIQD